MAVSPFLSALAGLQGKPAPEDEPYFAALGQFIAAYALAEANVHMLARHLTNLPERRREFYSTELTWTAWQSAYVG